MRKLPFYLILLALLALSFNAAMGAGKQGISRSPQNTTGSPSKTYFDINNISTVLGDNQDADIDFQKANAGFVFPKGSGKACVFESGFLWGGFVNGEVRVGGSTYRSGLQPGKILPGGQPEDPNLPKNRIYRVRPDYATADLSSEAADAGISQSAARTQYATDVNEWPAADGAPYTDVNHNGTYDPGVDIPGVPGAGMTVWFACNDMNANLTTNMYGSQPIGIELQVTVWAYSQQGALGNMLFKRYLMINKGANTVTQMYVSQWADPDDGDANDDYSGCDTSLSLGYDYNANAVDVVYQPLPPPAIGFDFFQGPIVAGSANDSAIFRGQIVHGKKNLPMTAFYYFANGDLSVTDPTLGDYTGSTQFYNFFQGKVGKTGIPFTDPNTGLATPFALAGDPQGGKGWIDGQVLPKGDRRIGLASGTFTMIPGDTQEVVVAEIAAGAIPNVDRLSAIGLLKFYDQQAQVAYNDFFDLPTPPPIPKLTATALNQEILLNWGNDTAYSRLTEENVVKGYKFQGYNVYQLPSASATLAQASRIATFDLVDGLGKIIDQDFDAEKGTVLPTVKQFGNDVGIQRYLDIKNDAVGGGVPLVNGNSYYFAVTAYNYNPDPAAVPNNLENPLQIITVVPHAPDPGMSYSSNADVYKTNVTHVSGIGDATVFYKVIDPTQLTGANYTVGFSTQPDKFTAAFTDLGMNDPDNPDTTALGVVSVAGSFALNPSATSLQYTVTITHVDSLLGGGILSGSFQDDSGNVLKTLTFTVATRLNKRVGTASGIWNSSDSTQPLTDGVVQKLVSQLVSIVVVPLGASYGTLTVPVTILTYPWYMDRTLNGATTRVLNFQQDYNLDSAYQIVDGIQAVVGNLTFLAPFTFLSGTQTAGTGISLWGDALLFGAATGRASELFGGGGSVTNQDLVQDLEFRFTGVPSDTANPNESPIIAGGSIATIRSASSASVRARVRIPFEVWEPERNRQINVAIRDRDIDDNSPWGTGGVPQWYRIRGRSYIAIIATPYNPDTSAAIMNTINTASANSTWLVVFSDGEGGLPVSQWHTGDVFKIKYANNLIPGTTATSDVYTFTAPSAKSFSQTQAVRDVQNINVFPNPYYGVNSQEINKYERFVTFSHLPGDATIRIFNLGGVLIRTLTKANDPGAPTQFQRWDLKNEGGLPVASGLYIAFIDLPGLGTTKVLKFSIIQERQILDRF